MASSKILNWIFLSFGILVSYFFVFSLVGPELHYHVLQPSFIWDWLFFTSFAHFPGDLLIYFTNFLLQFFSYKYLGAGLIILTGFLFFSFSYFISRRLFQTGNFIFSFIPLVLFLGLISDYNFPFAIAFGILTVYLFVFFYFVQLEIFL